MASTIPPTEIYTPGYAPIAVRFMSRRTAQTHAGFLLPHLRPGMRLLDCGCGPGTLTRGLAERVGELVAMDREASQLELAKSAMAQAGLTNVRFKQGSIYDIPLPERSVDAVFAHAVFEHLQRPLEALAEITRVLRPGGLAALRSPDWGGLVMAPDVGRPYESMERFKQLQIGNGGDVYVGRKFKGLLRQAGFRDIAFSAVYECFDPEVAGEFIAFTLETAGAAKEAAGMREWSLHPDAVFAQAWCEILGRTKDA